MLSLHTNTSTLNTQNSMASVNKTLAKAMTNLGTGFRVNTAMDDAAGLQIATRLNAQSRGMQVAQKNTQNGISMIQTAEGSMSEINNMLLRMKDLATESANGTSSEQDRAALQAEYDALGSEISNILKNTTFAGSNLFSDKDGKIGDAGALSAAGSLGTTEGITFQVGATAAEKIDFKPGADGNSLSKLMEALSTVSAKIGEPAAATTTPDPFALKLGTDTIDATTALSDLDNLLIASNAFGDVATNNTGGTVDVSGVSAANFADMKQAAEDKKTLITALAAYTSYATDLSTANTEYDPQVHTTQTEAEYLTAQKTAIDALKKFATDNGLKLEGGPADDSAKGTEINTGDSSMLKKLNDAINAVGTFRSDMGAVANRLEHTFNNLGNMITNTEISKGRILDVDFAKESSNMVKNQMLMQTSTAMLKQSNSLSQMVGSLVQ